ncbi:MAG: hypothetical protein R2789_17340 [Microthrixaceae bacterium]
MTLAIVMAVNTAIGVLLPGRRPGHVVRRRARGNRHLAGAHSGDTRFAVVITLIATLLFGILPQVVNDVTDFGLVALGG